MGNSLADQLLNAGVASKQQAQDADRERRKKQKQKTAKKNRPSVKKPIVAKDVKKAAKDREINKRRQQAAEQKAIAAQIQQLIEKNRLPRDDADVPYNFIHGKRVRKIHITATMQAQIMDGTLRIVRGNKGYDVVPKDIAEKITQRNPAVVIDVAKSEKPQEDDPYAEYQVPDDLVW